MANKEELLRRRQQCVGAMQYATRTLCNKKNVLLFDGMEYLTRPLEHSFEEEVRQIKTK